MQTLEQTVNDSHDWAINRIYKLNKKNIKDAKSIESEFGEWLDDTNEFYDVFSIEFLGDM